VRKSIGGAAAYSSIALKRYGVDVAIVSKVGRDFPEEYLLFLARNGVDISYVKMSKTNSTRFKLVYENGRRKLFLASRCEEILSEDLPQTLNYDLIHVGPVANEVPIAILKKLRKSKSIISLDLQGYVRSFKNGLVVYSYNDEAMNALRYANIVHGDEDEVTILGRDGDVLKSALKLLDRGPDILLVTKGDKGSYVLSKDKILFVPAPKPRKVVDPTGAGDIYTSIFLAHYVTSGDIEESAVIASSAASLSVEEEGLSGVSTYEEIKKRAKSIRDAVKEVKVS